MPIPAQDHCLKIHFVSWRFLRTDVGSCVAILQVGRLELGTLLEITHVSWAISSFLAAVSSFTRMRVRWDQGFLLFRSRRPVSECKMSHRCTLAVDFGIRCLREYIIRIYNIIYNKNIYNIIRIYNNNKLRGGSVIPLNKMTFYPSEHLC